MRIKVEQGQVFKTINSTTCTLLTRKEILKKTRATLLSYARKNSDWVCGLVSRNNTFLTLGFAVSTNCFPLSWVESGLRLVLQLAADPFWAPVFTLGACAHNCHAHGCCLLAPNVNWREAFEGMQRNAC